MRVSLSVDSDQPKDDLRSLFDSLNDDDSLRSHVQFDGAPQTGRLGISEVLIVALAAGGAIPVTAKAMSVVMVEWLRRTTSEVRVTLTLSDGASVEYSASHVRKLSAQESRALSNEIVHALTEARENGSEPS